MHPWSKIALLISGFFLIIMLGARFVLGAWHSPLYGFLALFALGFAASVFLDYKLYLEFLSIKTAKKGLNLGWSLLILIIFLVGISYLGNRFNKSFDLTEEGINSLSEQTQDVLKNLDSDLFVHIFYKGDKISPQTAGFKQELKSDLALYKQNRSKVKVAFMDTYKNNLKAEEYLSDLPDKNQQELFVFVNYKGRKVRAERPWTEESLTSAIIKVQKREFKEILFLIGHGEKDLNSEEPSGLKILNQALKDSGFIVKEWNFIQQGAPPKSPSLIISIGPSQPFLEAEKTWFKEHLSQGGSLFFSLDPKEKHKLTKWLKKNYGVIFNDDFILNQMGLLYGGYTKAIGVYFDRTNPITKRFQQGKQAVLFEKASSLDVDTEDFKNFQFSYLVKTSNSSFTVPELKENIKVENLRSLNLAVEVQPKREDSSHKKAREQKKDSQKKGFHLAVFGDSDFLSNRYIHEGANRDLALNTFVSLAGEEELVSIRPKLPKGTKLTLNQSQRSSLILFYIAWPSLFLLAGLWMWYRRREA